MGIVCLFGFELFPGNLGKARCVVCAGVVVLTMHLVPSEGLIMGLPAGVYLYLVIR